MNEYFINEEQYTRIATFLGRQSAKFNLSQEQMARMKPTPSELYVNAQFAAGGNVPLLNGNSTQEVGVTNFDGNRLDNGRFFVVDGVSIQYGEAPDATKVWSVKYDKELPAELLASNLVLRQNGEVIVKLPVASIENAKKSESFYRKLGALAIIEPTQTVDLTLETPAGSSITPASATDKTFIRVLLKGFETYIKR